MAIKKNRTSLAMVFFLFMSVGSFAYWEWTPKTSRWINPKYAVKETAEKQFQWAQQLRAEGAVEKSIREHQKLLKHFPESGYAAESSFSLGEFFHERGDIKKSFDYFQKIVDDYPQSPRVLEAIKKQFELAKESMDETSFSLFRGGRKQKGGMLAEVIERHPYVKESEEKAINLGKFYLEIKEYGMAKDVFSRITGRTSDASVMEEAHFHLIKAEYLSVPRATTNIEGFKKVKERLKDFIAAYPESQYRGAILDIRNNISNAEAEKYFKIAAYYERAGKQQSANYYYKITADNYQDTEYGKIASEKISSAP